jgi:hypothetical protein
VGRVWKESAIAEVEESDEAHLFLLAMMTAEGVFGFGFPLQDFL